MLVGRVMGDIEICCSQLNYILGIIQKEIYWLVENLVKGFIGICYYIEMMNVF